MGPVEGDETSRQSKLAPSKGETPGLESRLTREIRVGDVRGCSKDSVDIETDVGSAAREVHR